MQVCGGAGSRSGAISWRGKADARDCIHSGGQVKTTPMKKTAQSLLVAVGMIGGLVTAHAAAPGTFTLTGSMSTGRTLTVMRKKKPA